MKNPKAAILITGNEVLSGRTVDKNTSVIATKLGRIGIIAREVRAIPDNEKMIIDTVRELSSKYDYLFTTGGIGPTHDDITTMCVAKAFNTSLKIDKEIYSKLEKFYQSRGEKMNQAREKMACFPEGATFLHNSETVAPGFRINNVFVMAGIPKIMQAMLKSAIDMLERGAVIKSKSLDIKIGESIIAKGFEELQNKYPEVDMGSYPFSKEGVYGTTLILRSSDYNKLDQAYRELKRFISQIEVN